MFFNDKDELKNKLEFSVLQQAKTYEQNKNSFGNVFNKNKILY